MLPRLFDSQHPPVDRDRVQIRSANGTRRFAQILALRIVGIGLFGDGFSEDYAAEAEERWGETDAWKQSQKRTSKYTRHDWVQITKWFYDCSHEMHRGLAQMYLADPRFTTTYEDIAPGLAQYVHDAIIANCARHAEAES